MAVYFELERRADLYLTSLKNFEQRYQSRKSSIASWKMTQKAREGYDNDPEVMHISLSFEGIGWWTGSNTGVGRVAVAPGDVLVKAK
jgi:hypothetical protein